MRCHADIMGRDEEGRSSYEITFHMNEGDISMNSTASISDSEGAGVR